jgi:dTDP-4-dehydrorhamnose reductase
VKPLELWGGLECTLNRVGDRYVDQCEKNGHYKRLSDLKLFKDLGLKKLRYPCLWEKVAPKDLDHCDWSYLDERLNELKRLDQDFIAGFLHHGSGPLYTSLIDPDFPEKLATYARLFAQRYPWVNDYTPINEINTTARFSLMYGHWYPHLRSNPLYLKSLILQCKGTILAMREIRRVNPKARLIQTDDIGKCQSTEILEYQRDQENERRWLAWDLLCGKVTTSHPLYNYFLQYGITERELMWFEDNACPPDVIGLNHYLLSNRYLDHRMEHFPEWTHGGNGLHSYADVGAVDTGFVDNIEPEELFREAWNRYGISIAVTECHMRGGRESQIRWLDQIWKTAQKLHSEGISFEAVTVWSLLGTYDWHKLCTECENFYESGVFDLRNYENHPQPTALSKMVKALATEGKFESPLLNSEGTWKTARRILWNAQPGQFSTLDHPEGARPIIITGGRGTLGQAFARVCGGRNINYKLLNRQEMDITVSESIEAMIERYHPWAIINAAGYVRVDEAEDNQEICFKENVEGAVKLARICRDHEIQLVNFSSDLVFDGKSEAPYTESHQVSPVNVYGRSKVDCEEQVLSIYPQSLIIRTSAFFSPWDEHNFVTKTLRALADKSEVLAPNDMFVSPTYVPDLANECLDLMIDGEVGIIHLTNVGEVSWEQFANLAIASAQNRLNLETSLLRGLSADKMQWRAKRPRKSVLKSSRQQRLPSLEDAIERYFIELEIPIEGQQEIRQ